MKIVDWEEFSRLPSGTVYQAIRETGAHVLGPLTVRYGVLDWKGKPSDFVYCEMTPAVFFAFSLGDDAPAGVDDGEEVICHPAGTARDGGGGYDGRRWLIWEDRDRAKLAAWLLDPDRDMTGQDAYLHLPRASP